MRGMKDETWPCTVAEAEQALTAAAKTRDGRTTVHSLRHTGPFAIGADWDLDEALACVRASPQLAWGQHPVGHDLAAVDEHGAVYFDVRRPPAARATATVRASGAKHTAGAANVEARLDLD